VDRSELVEPLHLAVLHVCWALLNWSRRFLARCTRLIASQTLILGLSLALVVCPLRGDGSRRSSEHWDQCLESIGYLSS